MMCSRTYKLPAWPIRDQRMDRLSIAHRATSYLLDFASLQCQQLFLTVVGFHGVLPRRDWHVPQWGMLTVLSVKTPAHLVGRVIARQLYRQ